MRSKEELRKVAEFCEQQINLDEPGSQLQAFDAWIDFLHGVQRGLSWALGDIEEIWDEMDLHVKGVKGLWDI